MPSSRPVLGNHTLAMPRPGHQDPHKTLDVPTLRSHHPLQRLHVLFCEVDPSSTASPSTMYLPHSPQPARKSPPLHASKWALTGRRRSPQHSRPHCVDHTSQHRHDSRHSCILGCGDLYAMSNPLNPGRLLPTTRFISHGQCCFSRPKPKRTRNATMSCPQKIPQRIVYF